MYPATATATRSRPPACTAPKITVSSPKVATTSANTWAPVARSVLDQSTAGSSNIMFAATVPRHPPATCAAT